MKRLLAVFFVCSLLFLPVHAQDPEKCDIETIKADFTTQLNSASSWDEIISTSTELGSEAERCQVAILSPKPITKEQADTVLLAITDMPTGWAKVPLPENDPNEPRTFLCESLEEVEYEVSLEASFAETNQGPIVVERMRVYSTEELAIQDFSQFSRSRDCESYTDVNDNGDETEFSVGEVSYPTVGNESFVVRTNGGNFEFNILMTRYSNTIIFILYGEFISADFDQFELYVNKAFAKLASIE